MTDKEKLGELLTSFDIGFKDDDNTITCEEGMKNVGGYHFFFVRFSFTDEGKFVEMEVLE